MKELPHLFANNRAWAARRTADDPHFFERLCEIQRPDYLWIGCSDSRVPANEIVDLAPGEMFVHRNVANLVIAGDANCLAVVQYAVEILKVRHIIICGHYGCGGVRAVLEPTTWKSGSHLERWLAPLHQLAVDTRFDSDDIEVRWKQMCEVNVREQVRQLLATDVLTHARLHGTEVVVHGWIYDLRDGLLRDLRVSD